MRLCNKNRKKGNRLKRSLRVNVTSVRRGERKIGAGTKNRQNTQRSLHQHPTQETCRNQLRAKRRKNIHHTSVGYFRNSLRTVMGEEPLYRRLLCLEPERSVGGACVCVCVCASGGDRRTEEEIWHIWRGTQPGGGAQRAGMRQHPSADSRAAACGPTREGRTRLTHCTSSNSFTAKAVWVGGLLL